MTLTMQQEQGLAVARLLVKAGMPVFLAYPDPGSKLEYKLPMGWQQTECDPSVVDAWRPGMALCAVTGRVFDLVDIDPRSGGAEGHIELPHSYLTALTPSGGRHHFVRALGVSSLDGKVAPGIDVKSGTLEGTGRGFAFLAPTVRTSKVSGALGEYSWVLGPDGPGLPTPDQLAADGTGAMLRARVMELRRVQPMSQEARRVPYSVAVREFSKAMNGLRDDVRRWSVTGWGGEAHTGLLAATTHLARLNHEQAEAAFLWAFRAAGVEPDGADLAKLHSAIERAVPDIVIPDEQLSPQERFFLGGDSPLDATSHLAAMSGDVMTSLGTSVLGAGLDGPSNEGLFEPVSRERFRNRTPPKPTSYGAFGGVVPLFYDEGVHWVQGESESGKTWIALGVLVDVLRRGGTALMIDYEDVIDRVLERLDQLGVTDDEIERLVYVDGHSAGFASLVAHVATTRYDVMVLDGVTSALSQAGLKGRDEQELTRWVDLLPRRARMAVCIDHVTKDVEGRNGMAIGSQAKKSVVTGSSFEVRAKDKFGRGSSGTIELRMQKDKPGFIRGARIQLITLKFISEQDGSVKLLVPSAVVRDGEHSGDAFFADVKVAERSALAQRLLQAMSEGSFPAEGSGASADRSYWPKLRERFPDATQDLVRAVARIYKSQRGVSVTLQPEEIEWVAAWSRVEPRGGSGPAEFGFPTVRVDQDRHADHAPPRDKIATRLHAPSGHAPQIEGLT